MSRLDEARRMLHEGSDAVWPHGDFVKDCWLCRCIGIIETEARAPFVTVQAFDLLPGEIVTVVTLRDALGMREAFIKDMSDPHRFDALPPDRTGHIRARLDAYTRALVAAAIAEVEMERDSETMVAVAAEAEAERLRTASPQSMTYAEVARMLEGTRRSIEVMGEDGECSMRTIRGVQYVTKDDAMAEVDERLGFVLFLTGSAA